MKKLLLSAGIVSLLGGHAFASEVSGVSPEGFNISVGAVYGKLNDQCKAVENGAYDADLRVTKYNPVSLQSKRVAKLKNGVVAATVGVGYDWAFNNYFVGGEFLVDLASNKTKTAEKGEGLFEVADFEPGKRPVTPRQIKHEGVDYSFALRTGYILSNGFAPYAKVGFAHGTSRLALLAGNPLSSGYLYGDSEFKMRKLLPQVALGLEKTFCRKLSTKAEVAYTFKRTRNLELAVSDTKNAYALKKDDLGVKVKHSMGGNYSARLLLSYHI